MDTERETETESTFLVTHAEEETAMLTDVENGQIHTLSENPGVEAGDVLSGTLAPEPPMEVTWQVVSVDERRSITLERSNESPTTQAYDLAAEQETGEITRQERAGTGAVHIITVPPEEIEQAVEDVLTDEATLERAARLGVERVAVRADSRDGDGVVSVRYLP
jgi:hypothetical protein